MSFLEIKGRRHPIPAGESTIGSEGSSFIVLDGDSVTARHLVVHGTPDGQASVARSDAEAETYINGVKLGPQPTPLLHGDKIEVGSHELLFVDERRSGSTQFVRAEDLAKYRPPEGARSGKPGAATGATGGRLISLTDGREYTILTTPLVIGRDAGCDVVVASKRVSRRHAEIVPTPKGYVLVDASTNGTFVNGDRIDGERVLVRADIIRVGDDEFRFYADAVSEQSPDAAASEAPAPPEGAQQRLGDTMMGIPGAPRGPAGGAPPAPPPTPPSGAAYRLGDTMHGVPSTPPVPVPSRSPRTGEDEARRSATGPRSASSGVLASLVGRAGQLKGQRFPIRVPVVNVGRADYNDIVIPDGTVSTIHAKLQRREGIWVLIDLDSTNGTSVDGERVTGDVPLAPSAIIRFGDVSMVFEPTDDSASSQEGSSTRLMGAIDSPASSSSSDQESGAPAVPPSPVGGIRPAAPPGKERPGFKLWPFK